MNAYQVPFLKELNINPAKLGCLMMEVKQLPIRQYLFRLGGEDLFYTSPNPERFWIKGAEVKSHITLMYGFLRSAHYYRPGIEEVLSGWAKPDLLTIRDVGAFPSTFDDDPYSCIVAHIVVTPALLDAHARLSYLPHIDTFWEYKPHVTLAYVRKEREAEVLAELRGENGHNMLVGRKMLAGELDYGRPD